MTASQIIGKKNARWLTSHGLLLDRDQYFDNKHALLSYVKGVYLNRNIVGMSGYDIEEILDSDFETFTEIVARRLLRGE